MHWRCCSSMTLICLTLINISQQGWCSGKITMHASCGWQSTQTPLNSSLWTEPLRAALIVRAPDITKAEKKTVCLHLASLYVHAGMFRSFQAGDLIYKGDRVILVDKTRGAERGSSSDDGDDFNFESHFRYNRNATYSVCLKMALLGIGGFLALFVSPWLRNRGWKRNYLWTGSGAGNSRKGAKRATKKASANRCSATLLEQGWLVFVAVVSDMATDWVKAAAGFKRALFSPRARFIYWTLAYLIVLVYAFDKVVGPVSSQAAICVLLGCVILSVGLAAWGGPLLVTTGYAVFDGVFWVCCFLFAGGRLLFSHAAAPSADTSQASDLQHQQQQQSSNKAPQSRRNYASNARGRSRSRSTTSSSTAGSTNASQASTAAREPSPALSRTGSSDSCAVTAADAAAGSAAGGAGETAAVAAATAASCKDAAASSSSEPRNVQQQPAIDCSTTGAINATSSLVGSSSRKPQPGADRSIAETGAGAAGGAAAAPAAAAQQAAPHPAARPVQQPASSSKKATQADTPAAPQAPAPVAVAKTPAALVHTQSSVTAGRPNTKQPQAKAAGSKRGSASHTSTFQSAAGPAANAAAAGPKPSTSHVAAGTKQVTACTAAAAGNKQVTVKANRPAAAPALPSMKHAGACRPDQYDPAAAAATAVLTPAGKPAAGTAASSSSSSRFSGTISSSAGDSSIARAGSGSSVAGESSVTSSSPLTAPYRPLREHNHPVGVAVPYLGSVPSAVSAAGAYHPVACNAWQPQHHPGQQQQQASSAFAPQQLLPGVATAAGVLQGQQAAAVVSPAAAAGALSEDDDDTDRNCVICWERERTVGLLHADLMHLCLCSECAAAYDTTSECPICRQPVLDVIELS